MAVDINSGYLTGLLLESKADISIRDQRGRTALAYAKEKGSDEVMRTLQQQPQGIVMLSREEEGPKSQGKKRGRDDEEETMLQQPRGTKRGREEVDDTFPKSRDKKRGRDDEEETMLHQPRGTKRSKKEVDDDDTSWKSRRKNKHSKQVWADDAGCNPRYDIPFSRILQANDERFPYRRRKGEVKTVIHWGQRKLLMSEIEFLTLYGTTSRMVVYAGAAPGTHIAFLSNMFPELHFHCVDPAPFTVKETGKITIVQDLFSDEMAQKLGEEHPGLLFISDIRSADWERDNDRVIEEKVQRDMAMQKEWHMRMKPMRSMLKFRLPWAAGTTSYLDGDVYLPVWGPITTTETRLITKENTVAEIEYDHKKYEEQLFFFNTVTRPALYEHDVTEGEGIDHCYDCRAEVHILSSYLEMFKAVPEDKLAKEVSLMSKKISKQIANGRTLKDDNPDPADRKRRIQKNQWINDMPAYENYDGYGRGNPRPRLQ